MSLKERVFHAILFEVIALILLTLIAVLVTGDDIAKMSGLAIMLSLIAMIWNFVFNIMFDRAYGYDRNSRTFKVRILHGLGFEFGMLILSFPVMMWILQLDLLSVFLLDIGAMIFFLLYAIIFNWGYDITRERIQQSSNE